MGENGFETYEDCLRDCIDRSRFGAIVLPNWLADDIANWIEKHRGFVDVVRCKDCKHLDKGENDSESWCECIAHFGKYFAVNEDDYCSFGVRR